MPILVGNSLGSEVLTEADSDECAAHSGGQPRCAPDWATQCQVHHGMIGWDDGLGGCNTMLPQGSTSEVGPGIQSRTGPPSFSPI